MSQFDQDIGLLTLLGRLELDPETVLEVKPGGVETTHDRPLYAVIGASVAVCLFDTRKTTIGICNVMLPSKFEHNRDDAMMRADGILDALRNQMIDSGCSNLAAKLFGGAEIGTSSLSYSDGKQTAIFAKNWLRNHQIPVGNESLGGEKRREIIAIPGSGQVFCKQVSMSSEFLRREKAELSTESAPLNKVELF